MDSFILEDVNELLKLKKGDSGRLIRIRESCESNEIISLPDRKYVERLSSQYIREPEQKKPKKQDRPKFVSIEEQEVSSKKNENLATNQMSQIEKPKMTKEQLVFKDSEERTASKIRNLSSNQKVIFSIGSVALALILVLVVAVNYNGIALEDNPGIVNSQSLPDFSLETDRSSYETSDIISISGKMSSSSSGSAKLFIENENSIVWVENLNLKNNGEFSTLVIAGGQGWENSGKYFLNVEYNDFSNKISFDYIAK